MIQLSEAKKIYGKGESAVHALSGISLNIQKGEFVAITGKSGCGKTTLLNIIGLLDNLTEGHYTLNGQDVRHLSDKAKARLRFQTFGYIFQSFNLLSSHTVAENVALPLGYAGVPKQERLARAAEMLRKVGMLDKMKAYPNELSGGQQQRWRLRVRSSTTRPSFWRTNRREILIAAAVRRLWIFWQNWLMRGRRCCS